MPDPVTFFDHQEIAKKRSHWALMAFAVTVLLTATAVSFFGGLTGLILFGSSVEGTFKEAYWFCARISWLMTLAVIFVSWAWRASALAAGPEGVMKSMRAWRVPTETTETDQRQLLNLVEEMSIASGVPVPDVYIIDSTAINACAVGMDVDKAAIAVTRGTIVKLNRSELQGVIAHEFSHILHGDMAVNTHMIAWLAGLFTISELGRTAMESGMELDDWFDEDEAGANVAMVGIGCGIWVLGSLGLLFGKMLQASVSRQREYLADASAIQYTRNPEGLGNALRKLGREAVQGRMVRPPNDCGHMMFSQLRARRFAGVLSTHPPLEHRIRRVLPSWDGSYLKTMELKLTPPPSYTQKAEPLVHPEKFIRNLPSTVMLLNLLEDHKMDEHYRLGAVEIWKSGLDPLVRTAARHPDAAQGLMFALLMQHDQEKILKVLKERESGSRVEQVTDILAEAEILEKDRLGIVDLALPALRQMPEERKEPFMATLKGLCDADGQIDLFEYCLTKILEQTLESPRNRTTYQRMRVHIRELESEVNVMLSCLSRMGSDSSDEVARCFARAEERMFGFTAGLKLQLLPASECGLDALDQACEQLPGLAPNFQQRLLLAGLAAIAEDDHLHFDELQAFRAFAAVMRIPVPPGLGLV